jgi:hypothetical protein
MTKRNRFEIRRRSFDGLFNRWEQINASELGVLPTTVRGLDGRDHKPADYQVWVVTGVYTDRKQAFNR